ncbi:Metal-dependent hydrolase, endonuclease/exonuclease/phosphatase family [Pseudomonas taetrolens]|uniref:Endonuclease n=1 Tax=Pseudomonas taetrolens TaxID=47884 RepID=A0A0J6GT22_PSETA|nr:endonuclease/exonuclease/phosphatase family protein [Pseudomonas taetrolens]MBW0234726.1 endonuclease [Pseudomonas sp. D1HM]KMM84820.1 endonuclease [Pseudomonas taetrolens]SEB45081.1 Metal-dependent hydrolase, endonuclease/exonuclease/phosphatase family [Pseudomonas taetrolens]SQF84455.1 endonuclease/exonuclease/phosphatase family protein [Pseudomonas taetrolens]VEH45843.1 endonuclease/exonuclease/phosphatase family protein [Pseudomonas taetrolens]
MRRWKSERIVGLHEAQVNEDHLTSFVMPDDRRLRLLSFNIQVGNSTQNYRHYLTRSWQHVLPHKGRAGNLEKIGGLLSDFDLVALQEADGGSHRSGYVNQVKYLAQQGEFPYWYQQLNRNLGRLAQHSNGVLSRLRPTAIEDHPLPGPAGRGAILVRFGDGPDALVVVVMHLALGTKTRTRQLAYIRELIEGYQHQVLMGDMNTHANDLLQSSPLRDLGLLAPQMEATFPSWRPQRCLDHILLSSSLTLERVQVLDQPISDHLPVAVEIRLPGSVGVDSLPAVIAPASEPLA